MSRLGALRALKKRHGSTSDTSAPSPSTSAPVSVSNGPTIGRSLRPCFDSSAISKAPTGRCDGCDRPARLWVQAWPIDRDYRYFQNGVEVDGPSPQAYCTKSCAAEDNPSDRLVVLAATT